MVADERYQEDDFGEQDRYVATTPEGSAVVLPSAARRLRGEGLETFAMLQKVGLQLDHLERHVAGELVPAARDLGLSWSLIGAALGLTGEGARQRYAGVFGEV